MNCFRVSRAQICPQREMPVALWRTGLLLCFLGFCGCLGEIHLCLVMRVTHRDDFSHFHLPFYLCCLTLFFTEEECVLGIVGRPVSLSCFYNELSTFNNFSFEWRRGDSVVFRISAEAALAGDLSLELPIVDAKEHNVNYSLLIISEGNHSAPLCTVCLRIAGQCQTHSR